jgi:hypothetical protein
MIRETQDGEDFVLKAGGREYNSAEVEALRINGTTGKVSMDATRPQVAWNKDAADGAAGTATAEHAIFRAPFAMTIKAIRYIPDAALTQDNSNYATITVAKRNSGGAVTLGSQTTRSVASGGSGSWTQWGAVTIPVSTASVAAGDIITVAISKSGTGVVVPAGQLLIEYV